MDDETGLDEKPTGSLRYGWTTGACAAAAAKAAYQALLTGAFPDPVSLTLPKGQRPAFALASHTLGPSSAKAAIVKDAGDDPDVTHGALIEAEVEMAPPGSGVAFRAGEGVGTVTKPGLPLAVGEPAINPSPRRMIAEGIMEIARAFGASGDAIVTISVPDGQAIAKKTLNARLGILGGISILGTTGIVVPYSCSAWIHSIHRGIDVARAAGLDHVAGATGSTSEAAVARLYNLEETALIDMGDFVGGMLKYLRGHPVPRVTIAGGFAKMTKLAQGRLDLHSRRGAVDLAFLAGLASQAGAAPETATAIASANTALEALGHALRAHLPLADHVAQAAWATAAKPIGGAKILLDIAVFDRGGRLIARTDAKLPL